MTPSERLEKARAKNRLKSAKRRARKRAEKRHIFKPEISKTCPAYRRRLPPVPEMVRKSELRAFLAEAVRNTEGAIT